MKLLFLAWNYPPAQGGIEYVAQHVVSGLRSLGDSVRVIARYGEGVENEVDVLRPSAPGLLRYWGFSLKAALSIPRDQRPEMLVCPGIVDAPVAWVVSRLWRRPYVVFAHGSDLVHLGCFYRCVSRLLFRQAARVCANSAFTRDRLLDAGVPLERIRIIHPGVQASAFAEYTQEERAAIRKKLGVEGRQVILSVGRLIRRKGVLFFIEEVLPELIQDCPNVLYVVIGGDAADSLVHHESMKELIERRVVEKGLEKHVRMMGSVDDETLIAMHHAADVFVMPVLDMDGDVEGFGIVLLEASLAQTPLVAAEVGGVPEAVGQGFAGVIVKPGKPSVFSREVRRYLQDPLRARRAGAVGRDRVLKQFDWPVIVRQYRDFFVEILAS